MTVTAATTEWTWGVDCGASKVAIAMVAEGYEPVVRELRVGSAPGARRLQLLYEHTLARARLLAERWPPVTVWVELPVGRFHVPSLDHAVGVIQAAIYAGLSGLYPLPVPVYTVPPSRWKRAVGLSGGASKAAVFEWARQNGFGGSSQDSADAVGIAIAGASQTLVDAAA